MGDIGLTGIRVTLKNISKSFSNDSGMLKVLDRVNLEIAEGEFLGVLGASGSGKSTLLRLVAGFEQPDSGGIFLDGLEITGPGIDRVMIFQDFNQLFPWMTVLGNVLLPLKVNQPQLLADEQKEKALGFIKMVKLDGFESYYPHQLSGGMKQKAALARALALNPEVLLMDEPFGSLDAQTRNNLQQTLLEIWEKTGVTIIFVTHDLQEALILSDRIAVLSKREHRPIEMIDNQLSRPRKFGNPEFGVYYDRLYQELEV